MSNTQEVKIHHSREANFLYYMCLLDWGGEIIDEAVHKSIAQSIIPEGCETNGWRFTWIEDTQLSAYRVKPEFLSGFYHSRVILRFELEDSPKTISQVREMRKAIESFTENYLKERVRTQQKVSGLCPRVFIYPLFELNASCPFWEIAETFPYTLPTTCFYTDLQDIERPRWCLLRIPWVRALGKVFFPARVKMRISGAKLITTSMSDWFFWNLTNLIYHEGLYRRCRETQNSSDQVYKGFEDRLEDFADRLMTSFSQAIANVVQRRQAWWLVMFTILLLVLTIFSIVS